MNKNLRNGIIFLGVLVIGFVLNSYYQSRHTTKSSAIFDGDVSNIKKVLIQNLGNALELVRQDTVWSISGNDTLVVRENRIDNLLNTVLAVNRETLVSKNPEKWVKFSVDDSSGTHLALIDAKDETMAYFVFGRSRSDWAHNYVRINDEPEVYLTDTNVIHHLSASPTFWGEKPKPPEEEPVSPSAEEAEGSAGSVKNDTVPEKNENTKEPDGHTKEEK